MRHDTERHLISGFALIVAMLLFSSLARHSLNGVSEWIFDALRVLGILTLGLSFLSVRKLIGHLRESERRLAEAQQIGSVGSFEYTFATGQVLWSEEVYRLFDRDPAKGPPGHDELMSCYHPEDVKVLLAARDKGFRSGSSYKCDLRVRQSDGSYRWCHCVTQPIRSAEGKPLRLVGTVIDVTERKVAEQQIRALNAAMEQATEGIARMDEDGHYIQVNEAYASLAGFSQEEMIGRHWLETLPKHTHDGALHIYERMRMYGKSECEIQGTRADGSTYFKEVTVVRDLDNRNQFGGHFAFTRDITRRKLAESDRIDAEKRFRSAIEAMHDGLVIETLDGGITVCNRSAERLLGLSAAEILGKSSCFWNTIREDGEPWSAHNHPATRALCEGLEQHGVAMGVIKPCGEQVWISVNSVPLYRAGESKPYGVVMTFLDVTEKRHYTEQIEQYVTSINEANLLLELKQDELARANTRLEELASSDGLTGIKNHRAFKDRLADEFERAIRYHSQFSVLLVDVDEFKVYNDQFGHLAGDRILQKVASLMQSCARMSDFVGRYGGEEFVLILPDTNSLGAFEAAERIRRLIQAYEWESRPVTVSIGVSTVRQDTNSVAELIEEADSALYASKHAGRNRTTLYYAPSAEAPAA
jgi:diguanylate cyclase (GGDEF)-like protein/PAS domain S-box-containing protein